MKKQITVVTRTICSSNIPINKSRLIVTLSLLCFISIYSCVLFSATALAQSSDCQKFLGGVANREYVDYINMLNHVPDNAKNATAFDLLKPGEYKDTVDPYCRFSGCEISKIKAPGRAFQTQKVENAITLIKAIEDGQLATVKQYVPSSVNVNSIVPGGFTTVAFANPNEGTGGAEEWCTTTKVSPGRKFSIGRSLLGVAIGFKHPEIADYLISVGADVNLKDKKGSTPLMIAAANNADLALVQKLLSSGADVRATDINGNTALHQAAMHANSDIFNKLIASGADADINAKNLNGYTVLHFAAYKGAVDIVKTILNTGYNVNTKNNKGRTALYDAQANVLRTLIEAGGDINARDKDGLTPLHANAGYGDDIAIQILIGAGADIYAIDKFGKTPHNYAIEKGHQSALKVLYSQNTSDDSTNFKLFNKVLDACYHRNDQTDDQIDAQRREKAKQLTIEYLKKNGYANKTDEKIMRTKAYADQFEIHYKSVIQKSAGSPQKIQEEYNACVKLSIQNFSDEKKLPIIYNYCKGSEIAWSGSIGGDAQSPDPIPPETILTSDEFSFKNCIESFAIYNDDYVTSKEYFLNRLQEDYNRFSKEAKKVRKDIAKAKKKSAEKQAAAAKKAQQNFIYWNSPRGKCESRCNQTYKKNTSMWTTCMDPCKDMRSDILDY